MDINYSPEARELKSLLLAEGVAHLIDMELLEAPDGYLRLELKAAMMGKLGAVLATLSREDELDDPGSLSRRLARPDLEGHWRYELTLGRYPHDRTLVFRITVLLPASDLPEVVSRLRQ